MIITLFHFVNSFQYRDGENIRQFTNSGVFIRVGDGHFWIIHFIFFLESIFITFLSNIGIIKYRMYKNCHYVFFGIYWVMKGIGFLKRLRMFKEIYVDF